VAASAEVCWFRGDPVRVGARDSGRGGRSPRARSGRGLGRARWRGACAGPPFGLVDPAEG
jgi:hypothetical protein